MPLTKAGRAGAIGSLVLAALVIPVSPAAAKAKPAAHLSVRVAHHRLTVGATDAIAVLVGPKAAHVSLQQKVRGRWLAAISPKHNAKGSYTIRLKSTKVGTVTYRVMAAATASTRSTASAAFAVTWVAPPAAHVLTLADVVGQDASWTEHTSLVVPARIHDKSYPVSMVYAFADAEVRAGDAYTVFDLGGKWKSFHTSIGVSDASLAQVRVVVQPTMGPVTYALTDARLS